MFLLIQYRRRVSFYEWCPGNGVAEGTQYETSFSPVTGSPTQGEPQKLAKYSLAGL